MKKELPKTYIPQMVLHVHEICTDKIPYTAIVNRKPSFIELVESTRDLMLMANRFPYEVRSVMTEDDILLQNRAFLRKEHWLNKVSGDDKFSIEFFYYWALKDYEKR